MARFSTWLAGLWLALPLAAGAQGVLIGPANAGSPAAGAALEVRSDTKGFLPPRLTYANRAGMSNAVAGMLVYQSDSPAGQPGAGYYYYTGGGWLPLQTQGDNLGSHVATTNLDLNGNKLLGTAGNVGLRITNLLSGFSAGSSGFDPNAVLDFSLTERGVVVPRFNQQARDNLGTDAPAGLVFFNTDTNHLNLYDGTAWQEVTATPLSTTEYTYTAPGLHTYVVPSGVTSVHLEVAGAAGSNHLGQNLSGLGGLVTADLQVQPNGVLYLLVGGTDGSNGDPGGSGGLSLDTSSPPKPNPNGENGGGASEVRYVARPSGSLANLPARSSTNVQLVAGGGGGGASYPAAAGGYRYVNGGDGGLGRNPVGGAIIAADGGTSGNTIEYGGGGATATAAGRGGRGSGSSAGVANLGGTVKTSQQSVGRGFGPGGGGGGYFGGGSGSYADGSSPSVGGGGGGGSYALSSGSVTNVVHTRGAQAGNGYIKLTVNQ